MASEQDQQSSEDVVSLEDLVLEAGAPSPAGPPVAASVAVIDKVLEVEDPAFVGELKALKEAGAMPEADFVVDSDVDQLVEKEKVEKAARGRKKLLLLFFVRPWRKILKILSSVKAIGPWMKLTALPATKTGVLAALSKIKAGLGWFFGRIKAGLDWFKHQTGRSKLLILTVIGLAIAAGTMTRLAMHGRFLPTLEQDFVYSFANGADQVYKFEDDEKWQDLNDPLLHPEHIVLLERLIVNLRTPADGSNPMALLDLYVEASSKETAVEIKSRDAEVRDMVLRTMEQMAYDELVTDNGKNKLKVFLRKNLNEMLSTGRVRRLFFKSIVLKP